MGIAGLHGLLKSIQKPCNLKKFKGQTLGVDAYGWLHRGTASCAIDLALDKHTTKFVEFAMNRVRMLLYFGVKPYLVFDGDQLPSKAGTEVARASRREESKKLGLELYRKGRTTQAHQELQKAVDVTPCMARMLIEELKKANLPYIVAPYEADAQLVYLEKQGIINGIISEDSDLLVFGAKRLLSKLDQHGDCVEINRGDFSACRDISLIGWTDANFRHMCILSGCDYLQSLPKMGLKTAYRAIRKYKTVDKVLRMVQFEGQCRVPADYLEGFKRADLTFLHQRVFCPKAGTLVPLTPLSRDIKEELTFIGDDLEPDTATRIACGDLDPMTKELIHLKVPYPERSRLVATRRQTLPPANDLKPTRRITSFFTPKRIPLGELDPNSLTPSPSQQRTLERNTNRSWEASPLVATRSTNRRSNSYTPSAMVQSSQSMAQTSDRDRFLTRAAAVSTFNPVKRPRLCSDTDEGLLPGGHIHTRSRFFPATTSKNGNVSAETDVATTKKAKRASFEVFSDELVEDFMYHLADSSGPTAERSLLGEAESANQCQIKHAYHSQQDEPSTTSNSENGASCSGSPVDVSSEITSQSQMSSEQSTEASSLTVGPDSQPVLFNKVLQFHIEQQNLKIGMKCESEGPVSYELSKGSRTTAHSRTASTIESFTWQPSGFQEGQMQATPLQRIKERALIRPKSLDSMQWKARGHSKRPQNDPESSPYGSTLAMSSVLREYPQGSEDLIVPNSEDEGEDYAGKAQASASLDLSMFRFAAA